MKEKLEALLKLQDELTENRLALELAGWEPDETDRESVSAFEKAKKNFLEEFDIETPPDYTQACINYMQTYTMHRGIKYSEGVYRHAMLEAIGPGLRDDMKAHIGCPRSEISSFLIKELCNLGNEAEVILRNERLP